MSLVEERGASTGHGAEHDHGTGTGGGHHDPAHAPHATAADSPASTHDAVHEHPRPADAADFDGPPADPANRRPIPSWITDRLASTDLPAWKKRILQGHEFNYANHHRYPENEVETNLKTRLDSYLANRWIVSRKHTQVSSVSWRTMKRYIDEIDKKYAPGVLIKKTQLPLFGNRVLELPPQATPIPQRILDYASRPDVRVILRDSNGRAYNAI